MPTPVKTTSAKAVAARRTPKPVNPLAHLIPNQEVFDSYVPRQVRGMRDLDIMAYARETQKNVMLYGPTGIGKTMMVSAFAASQGIPLTTISANGGLDPMTLFGQWEPDESGKFHWVYSDMVDVFKAGGLVFVDEVNFMAPKATAAFHSMARDRQLTIPDKGNELVEAGDGFIMVVAFNPVGEYEGTRPLNKAFRNRFAIKMPWGYDQDVEKALTCMPVTLEIARKLRAQYDAGEIETPIGTNMLVEFEDIAAELNADFAIENFVAAFAIEEQEAVRTAIQAHRFSIDQQLAELLQEVEDEA
jgi:MoxR-like ATPase